METSYFEIQEANILGLEEKLARNNLGHCFLCETMDAPEPPRGPQASKTVMISTLLPLDANDVMQTREALAAFRAEMIREPKRGNRGVSTNDNTL